MSARKAAMEFMSATVQGLPATKLAADEADFLTTFYVDRLKGEGEQTGFFLEFPNRPL